MKLSAMFFLNLLKAHQPNQEPVVKANLNP
jgi:hypothetical protein